MTPSQLLRAAAGVALFAALASAQTVVVTTSKDVVDIPFFTGTLADLPGPDGKVSFQEALIATDNAPGQQTIAFNIPQSDWTLQFLFPGAAVLTGGVGGTFRAFDSVIIDGTTQTAFTGDTNSDGAEVALYGSRVVLLADNSELRGFHSGELTLVGDSSLVTGNTGGMHIEVNGDSNLIQGNTAGTIKIYLGNQNVVVGNTMQRVRIWGAGFSGPVVGNRIGGPTPAERNFITGYGVISGEGVPSGSDVELFTTKDTLIENNSIGTTLDGMSQGNLASAMGIDVQDGNTGLRVRDNRIAGVLGHGQPPHWAGTLWGWAVYFQGSGSDIEFTGNTIGLDATGAPTLPSVWGFDMSSSSYTDVRIGGPAAGDGNTIAGSYLNGVTIGKGNSGVRLEGNSIYGNATSGAGFIGLDLLDTLGTNGVSLNDPLDADLGGNGLQNFPVLTSAIVMGPNTQVNGALDSTPNQVFTLEFFANSSCDATGFGQGELPLGTATVTTDGSGHADFSALVAAAPSGWQVVATATLEPIGSTSEFSACVPTTTLTCAADLGFQGPGMAVLSICGAPLASGASANLSLTGASPAAPAWVVFGTSFSPTSLFGGTVVPLPGQVLAIGTTDVGGDLSFGPIPGGGGPVTLFVQAAYLDSSLPGLLGLSNAVQLELLP